MSSNGNMFCITGPLWGKSIGHRWISLTKASDTKLWCFLWSTLEQMFEQSIKTLVMWDATTLIVTSLYWIIYHCDKLLHNRIVSYSWYFVCFDCLMIVLRTVYSTQIELLGLQQCFWYDSWVEKGKLFSSIGRERERLSCRYRNSHYKDTTIAIVSLQWKSFYLDIWSPCWNGSMYTIPVCILSIAPIMSLRVEWLTALLLRSYSLGLSLLLSSAQLWNRGLLEHG